MSNKLSTEDPKLSVADKQNNTKYHREFLPGIVGYVVALLAVLVFVDEESKWAPLWSLLPVLPMIWVSVAVYRSYRRGDEYQRLVQAESMALGFGVAMIGSLAFGFLGIAGAVHAAVGPWVVFSLAMATWFVGVAVRLNR